jgi:hypothetical protein
MTFSPLPESHDARPDFDVVLMNMAMPAETFVEGREAGDVSMGLP